MKKVKFKEREISLLSIDEIKDDLCERDIRKMQLVEERHNSKSNDKICGWTKIQNEYIQVYESEVIDND